MRSLGRKGAKLAVLPVGIATRRRTGDVVALLYHRVGVGSREIDLPRAAFASQMRHLAATGACTLEEGLRSGGIVVTFDDGTADFHEHALPELVRYRVPALLYLATAGVGDFRPAAAGAISWDALRDAVSTGVVAIGSHTHTHADLSRASESEAYDEMLRSKELIEDRLGVACEHFAYPWAVGSPAADRAARRLFRTAAWDAWRTNRRGRIDPYRIGRVPILRSDGDLFFRAKAQGWLDGEALVYRALRRGPWGRA